MKQKKRVEINRFDIKNNSNEICCDKFYNYCPTGILNDSLGIKNAEFPQNYEFSKFYELVYPDGMTKVEGISLFRQHFKNVANDVYRLIIYGDDKKIYINQLLKSSNMSWLYQMTFENNPITLAFKKDNEDAVILTDGEQMKIWVTNYTPYSVEGVPIITDMCMNEGVLYCCLKEPAFKIWYATDLNPEKVGEIDSYSGYISFEDNLGNANRVITVDENVYVIRDYGISKITSMKGEFVVSQIYAANTQIYSETACVCGNVLLFMTKEGLYSYNGVKVSKTNLDFYKNLVNTKNMVAASLGSKYYLACNLNFEDEEKIFCENEEYKNNALIIFDISDNIYQIIRGADIKSLVPIKTDAFEKMIVLFNTDKEDKVGEIFNKSKYFDENFPKLWLSEQIFSSFEKKLFTKLTVSSTVGVKVKLIYDDKDITFTTYKDGANEFLFKIYGKQLKIEISSEYEHAKVEKVYLDYYDN